MWLCFAKISHLIIRRRSFRGKNYDPGGLFWQNNIEATIGVSDLHYLKICARLIYKLDKGQMTDLRPETLEISSKLVKF